MSNNCCESKQNFGHPLCVSDFGVITSVILVPLKNSLGVANIYDLATLDYNVVKGAFYSLPASRWFGLPQLQNVEYAVADTQFEEASSGKKSFLRQGKVTITAESWDKDATSVLKGKLAKVRCSEWGVFYVTDANVIIGRDFTVGGVNYFAPIPMDSQSFDPKLMFKTDSANQKIMLSFDLDRNFDDSTYYAISGDVIWDNTLEVESSFDFNDLPTIIDSNLVADSVTTTGFNIVVNDDYRVGTRFTGVDAKGNVEGLLVGDFLVENLTTALSVTPTTVTEDGAGNYVFVVPAQTSADEIKVSLVIDPTKVVNYNGSVNFLIP